MSEKIATGRPFADIALPIIAAALSAGQADARRYRWLKCGGWEVLQDSKYWLPELDFDGAVDNAIASVAIDAAIAASGESDE